MARDVTIFTDDSVTCEGPIVTGPALDEWVKDQGKDILIAAGLGNQGEALQSDDFASRQIQSHYLKWAHDRAVRSLPRNVHVTEHRTEAVGLAETDSGQRILLADGGSLTADIVVLAQGFLDREPTSEEAALSSAAKRLGLTYIPPGYTADVDLSDLRAGEPVLVRGFGLAFIDLMVLLGEGRGGRFSSEPASNGGSAAGDAETLTYHPSGREPLLFVGSRRGVPYHAKLGYALPGRAPTPPRYFTPAAVAALAGGRRHPDFRSEDLAADRERIDRRPLPATVRGASRADAGVLAGLLERRWTLRMSPPSPLRGQPSRRSPSGRTVSTSRSSTGHWPGRLRVDHRSRGGRRGLHRRGPATAGPIPTSRPTPRFSTPCSRCTECWRSPSPTARSVRPIGCVTSKASSTACSPSWPVGRHRAGSPNCWRCTGPVWCTSPDPNCGSTSPPTVSSVRHRLPRDRFTPGRWSTPDSPDPTSRPPPTRSSEVCSQQENWPPRNSPGRRAAPGGRPTAGRRDLPGGPTRRIGPSPQVPARAFRLRLGRIGRVLPARIQRAGVPAERRGGQADPAAAADTLPGNTSRTRHRPAFARSKEIHHAR